jgi:hypothetical protein
MKPMFKKMCFLLAMYQLVILIACNKCTCPPVQNKKINLQSITAENIIWKIPPTNQYDYQIYSSDTLSVEEYGINLKIETAIVFSKPKSRPCSFVNNAYACDCATGTFSIADSIIAIKILAQRDLGSIKKGMDLSSSFSILYTTHNNKIAFLPSSEALSVINDPSMNNLILPVQFICTDKTLKGNLAAFSLSLKSKSGAEYSADTKAIFLR